MAESILNQMQDYYGSYSTDEWIRTFPISLRPAMKEMIMGMDLHVAFLAEPGALVHPTKLLGRYLVTLELMKSKDKTQKNKGIRLAEEVTVRLKPAVTAPTAPEEPRDEQSNPGSAQNMEMGASKSASALGARHPVSTICRLLPQVADKEEMSSLAWRMFFELMDENIGDTSEESLRSKLALAGDLVDQTRYAEAEALLKEILAVKDLAPTHYYVRSARFRLGRVYRLQGRYREAEDMFYEVMSLSQQLAPRGALPTDGLYIGAQLNLGKSLSGRREYRSSRHWLEAALERCDTVYGADHRYTASVQGELEGLMRRLSVQEGGEM